MRKRTPRSDEERSSESMAPPPSSPLEPVPLEAAPADSAEVSSSGEAVPPDPPTAPSLVWPPPEDELNGWEVLQLHSTGHTIVEPMRYSPEGLVPLAPATADPAAPAPPPADVSVPAPPNPPFARGAMPRPAVRPSGAPPAAWPHPAPPAETPPDVPPSSSDATSDATPPLAWPAHAPADASADPQLPETQVIEPLMLRALEAPPPSPSDPPTEPNVVASGPPARPRPSRPSLVPPPLREPDPDDTNPALMTRILPVPSFAKGPRPIAPSSSSASPPSAQSSLSMEDTLPTSIPRAELPPSAFTPPAPSGQAAPASPGDVLIRPVTTTHPQAGDAALQEPVAYAPPPPAPLPVPVSASPAIPGADPVPVEPAPAHARSAATRGSQFWKLGLWLVALAAIVLAGYLLVRTLYPSAAAPTTASVVIDSTPAGADVLIDGELRGTTPFRGEIAPGTHRLELRTGSASRSTELTLQAGTFSSHTFEFAPAPAAVGDSAIEVRSDPSGARVLIGGVARGVTPIVVTGLAPGRHQVQVSGPFRPVTRSVTVSAGQQALLVITPARSAAARAETAPTDGAQRTTPAPDREAAAARQGRGYITIESPLVLRVVRNGEFVGTSDDARLPLPVGSHVIGLENESVGFREVRTVEVVAGRTATVNVSLPQGSLNINARPWAEVFVGGQRVGETPLAQLALPIGTHEIVFRHPDHGERRITTVVRVGAPGRAFVDFTR